MTSEVDGSKTNEFLRRRKLRLQQVREQSKDIAKKIRQRAKVENLRQIIELDSKKKEVYLQRQAQLVQKLEEYYAEGLESLGASHKHASEVRLQDAEGDYVDLSKQRGREAAAQLRKKRQQVLDKQKEILDRKLQAREVANEFSRDKSATINKLLSKSDKGRDEGPSKSTVGNSDKDGTKKDGDIVRSDMATQWDLDEVPQEWEPNIPTLMLPSEDNSVKELNNNNADSKSDKSKRLDLFALSEEMPSSLRGSLTNHEERAPVKSSLTIVSEYLQNRDLRLREPGTNRTSKKTEDFQSLKQTILRTRASKEGKEKTIEKQFKTSKVTESIIPKKSLVTMYNHTTRDSRDIPYADERLVVRNSQDAEDAYSQAIRESSTSHVESKVHTEAKGPSKKTQEIRSKVAVSKQNVEKEYRDTMTFLNALPKDKGNKPIKAAYMDEKRQQMQRDMRQQKLQDEYRKIEKECSKHTCKNKLRPKSRSPAKESRDMFESTDFQYSWMPVPECNSNLAIHTIPTTLKEGKSSTVKFSKVDSYHEYRSRHKHTPPTKESALDRPKPEASQLNLDIESSSDSESASSVSSVQSVRLVKREQPVDRELKDRDREDAERIIIYKILDSKADDKKTSKLMKSIAKSLTRIESKAKNEDSIEKKKRETKNSNSNSNPENIVSIEQLNEGVYRTVDNNGDNIASMYFQDREGESTETKSVQNDRRILKHRSSTCSKHTKQPEMESATRNWNNCDESIIRSRSRSSCGAECRNCCCKTVREEAPEEQSAPLVQPSAATSTTSFKTAANDKATAPEGGFVKVLDETGYETGKFYIGASGLLKNDAYEVVIQLRKKGEEKEVITEKTGDKKEESLGFDKVNVISSTQTSLGNFEKSKDNKTSSVTAVSDVIEPEDCKETEAAGVLTTNEPEVVSEKISKQTVTSFDLPRSVDTAISTERKVSEKGVSAVIEDPNAPNLTPTPRPATSTYTQTSIQSPCHRPAFFHLSSSTSTAYMSPPEMILPEFMRPDYQLTDQDIGDPRNYDLDEVEVTEQHKYSVGDQCECRTCLHARRLILSKHVPVPRHRCSKSKHFARTPPNTERSTFKEHIYLNRGCEDTAAHADGDQEKESKCACSKCATHKKSLHSVGGKHSSRNLGMRVSSSTSSFKKGQIASKLSKSNLKPIIKDYVDKLLVLNKENLKAVQILDQDCSSVTTPGSSVIDNPNNMDKDKPNCENKLSLQQIKVMLEEKLIGENEKKCKTDDSNQNSQMCYRVQSCKNNKIHKILRKKNAHKVKSLNISKKLANLKTSDAKLSYKKSPHFSPSKNRACESTKTSSVPSRSKVRSKSSPTPRLPPNYDTTDRSVNSDVPNSKLTIPKFRSKFSEHSRRMNLNEQKTRVVPRSESSNRAQTSTSNDSDRDLATLKRDDVEIPMTTSTQTSINADSEVNYMKLAEDKLQNMEKIADLTEKCTKRLSNLAKVLEEVRKNKTLAYSHLTTSDASDSDQKSDKGENKIAPPQDPSIDVNIRTKSKSPEHVKINVSKQSDHASNSTDYMPFLSTIPKPITNQSLNSNIGNSSSSSSKKSNNSSEHENTDNSNKHRAKPPPALSRVHMRLGQDFVVPHELSTVVEVDSPMSVKLKSSRNGSKLDAPEALKSGDNDINQDEYHNPLVELKMGDRNNPDLLDGNEISNEQHNFPAPGPSNDQMINIKQFNEIMLKPFYSIQEYAKQYNIDALYDGSNLDDIILQNEQINDELSSLHSEASLPDVISELLKRNIISEPFKFDSESKGNSTTVSSESTISVLALSRTRQGKHKSSVMFQNKENISETSDTMSFSSNPDLENAFKKLGMGWASSTLKKTKERLELSSSSNTSSSSLSQFRLKGFNQDIPALVSDTVPSVPSLPIKLPQRNMTDNSKNAEQQTSKTNAMTVKEFLTKELSKKITFNNKSTNETQDEYVSLYETKMPEQMKHSSLMVREENRSIDNSLQSGNNRARTSTPVQLYKTMTFHSSSSSNISNGLFSNVEDLSSVKGTSNSMKHSTTDKDDLIIPNFSLRLKKHSSECSKSD